MILVCFLISVGSPAPRQKRDADHGDTCTTLLDNCDAVSYCDDEGLTVGTCKLTWWFILIIVIIVLLVIAGILFAIWKALGLSCMKIKLMMMVT